MRMSRNNGVKERVRASLAHLMETCPGTSNADLARACGVGRASVTKWLSGESGIDVEHIPAICDYFGISVGELFGESSASELSPHQRRLLEAYDEADETGRALIESVAEYTACREAHDRSA